jgi:hypothetical protein
MGGGESGVSARKSKSKDFDFTEFRCRRCGRCCTGEGYVNLEPEECRKIADYLGIPVERFLDEYTRHEEGYLHWLKDGEGEDLPCIFLERDENGLASCRIEGPAKPRQCCGFPMTWRYEGIETWCAGFQEDDEARVAED